MRWSNLHAARGAMLSLLCVIGAVLPSVDGGRSASPVAAAADSPSPLVVSQDQPIPGLAVLGAPPVQFVLGDLALKKAPVPAGPSTYVPILLYHYIRVNPIPGDRVGFNLSTPPVMFRAQMQYLAEQGFHVIALHQAVVAIQRHRPLPSRSVVLTFDDGYADFFTEALPAMRSHGFTATDFVISGRMGQWSFMTASQVLNADTMGFTIGAHTVDHYALAALNPARASWEMRQSRTALEALLGHPVLDFAYPYGSFNAYDVAQAKSLGFETAVSTLAGTVHTPAQLMYLSRVRIGGAMSLATFAHLVGGPAPTVAEVRAAGATPAPGPSSTPAAPNPPPSPTATPAILPSPSSRP
jgi:peptidoglycan/xylan/chitin deacetylase (PgdA/CDA1 family)